MIYSKTYEDNTKKYETKISGRKIVVEIEKYAFFANASVMVGYGDTRVLTTVTSSSKPREGIDFFPLSVDYEERKYAIGKIPGGFVKREGRPSDRAIVTSRMIDRSLRPLFFLNNCRNDVSIVSTVLSVQQDNPPDLCAVLGASVAVSISDIFWNGPIATVFVGYVNERFIINPNSLEKNESTLNLTVSGSMEKIIMIEANANEITEEVMLDAIFFAHEEIKRIINFILKIKDDVGKQKNNFKIDQTYIELVEKINDFSELMVAETLLINDKILRKSTVDDLFCKICEEIKNEYPVNVYKNQIENAIHEIEKKSARKYLLNGKRLDGRELNEIRPMYAKIGILPRTHGSALFNRGQTQVLTTATLGTPRDMQTLDGIDEEEEYKKYVHHYNFPPYSVGETKPLRGPGRREIGHGTLAEKSLEPVLPLEHEFSYAIRLVSEVLSSNGSTSQASVCASTLALIDAGVPIKNPVAGISIGLVTDSNTESFVTMVDIQGIEDFFGDMDFKVAGTKKGITSIQLDIKIDGLTNEIIKTALFKARDARYYILDEIMNPIIATKEKGISKFAPKVASLQIPTEKIKDIIGSGGKIIQKITSETGAEIDVENNGKIFVSSNDQNKIDKALNIIKQILKVPMPGEIYEGKIVSITDFGAFVEIFPGKDGLIHISKLSNIRIDKVEDVVKLGETVKVEVLDIDKQGKINLKKIN
ncbi:MAG: polyribonucleotide nucleotidyltransferase [Clostridiales bacterium]|nr:polyribonucleotide nucleotidyltransferase [Clostridiales bacterium]